MEATTAIIKYPQYPAYKDSGVEWLGKVPENWRLSRLGTYFSERKTKVSDKDFPPLSVTKNGILPQLETAAKSNDGDNRKLVKKGDFVINSRSDRKGSSGIANQDGSVSLINIVMVPKSIYPVFCNYLLKSTAFVEENYRIGHGIVADLWTTRYDEMKNIKIAIPPLPEQTAIANFLDDKCAKIDRAIAQKEKLIALLKERKQIVIQNAVTGKTVWSDKAQAFVPVAESGVEVKDSGVEWIGEIPVGWEVSKFKNYIKLRHGHQFLDHDFTKEGIEVVKITQLHKDGYLDLSKATKVSVNQVRKYENILIKEGDVLMCLTGGTIGKIIRVGKVNRPLLQNYRVGHFSAVNPDQIKNDYIYYLMSSEMLLEQIFLGLGETGQPNIGMEDMKNMIICVPPIQKQTAIIAYIEAQSTKIDQAITLQQTQIDKLREYKATLIDSAVRGKIKVPGV